MKRALVRAFVAAYLWACRRLYNEFAWAYDRVSWLVSAGRWAHWRRLALEYVVGPRILEIGFGTGELLAELRGGGAQVYGLEPSAAMQRITARKLAQRGLQVPRVRASAERSPFSAGCFDTVVTTFPADYIVSPAALQEIARMLRPPGSASERGGRLVVAGAVVYRGERLRPDMLSLALGDRAADRFEEAASAAGLAVGLISRFDPPVRLPVFIAERTA